MNYKDWLTLVEITDKFDKWEMGKTGRHIIIVAVKPWHPRYLYRTWKARRMKTPELDA